MSTKLFGGGARANTKTQPAAALRIQTSVQGKCVPLVWGQVRLSGNLIWYGDFAATAQQQSGGGKGGVFGGGGQASTTYTYSAAVAIGICEGPVAAILGLWDNKTADSLSHLGFVEFDGGYSQSPWGYLTTLHPGQDLNYRGLAYVGAGPLQLGAQPELPNFTFEVLGTISNAIVAASASQRASLVTTLLGITYPGQATINGLTPAAYATTPGLLLVAALRDAVSYNAVSHIVTGSPDANPKDVVTDFLTNAHYGVPGWPSGLIGDWTNFANSCQALGLVVSPALVDQREASGFLKDLLEAVNCDPVWSGGLLNIVPRGDQSITANGATYSAPSAPQYDLTDDDFLPDPNGGGPVRVVRKRQSDRNNSVSIEYLDRSNAYNPAVIEAKDDAAIASFGLRKRDVSSYHFFCLASAAQQSVTLALGREQIPAEYSFSLGPQFVRLDPADLVTVTSVPLGLTRQWVRITVITENADGSFAYTAEEYLNGTASAPLYGGQAGAGNIPNYNAAPGALVDPFFFEPTDELAGGLQIWGAVAGVDTALWGGCDVWVSTDGVEYAFVDRILGPSRYGVLTATLPTITQAPVPPTIDQAHTLAVDLAISAGTLSSGSTQDALALSTACYVDGEIIAYHDAAPTGSFSYNLNYLVRGVYGTEDAIGAHASGSAFVRLDNGIFKIPFNQNQIGSTVYIKLLSFNVWHGGAQSLADVSPYTYTILGTALASPLPNVANLRSGFVGNISQILWDEVADFRPIRYLVSKGSTYLGSQILRNVAHPPFATQGDGTYWVTAISEPVPGLVVFSEAPQSLLISGSTLVENVWETWDEAATGWGGTFTGGSFTDGVVIRTGSSGDILGIADFLALADFLNAGGTAIVDGSYQIPTDHVIVISSARACKVDITWTATGQLVTADLLGIGDFLAQTDFLGYGMASRVDVYPMIRMAQGIGTGFLARTDFLSTSDFLHDGDWAWGDWQKYETAYYTGMAFDAMMVLSTNDPAVIAEALSFVFSVDVPDRNDDYDFTTTTSPHTLAFQPNGGASPAAFNGGPGTATVPNIQASIINPSDGDEIVITDVSLAACLIAARNAGSYVARNMHVRAQGF